MDKEYFFKIKDVITKIPGLRNPDVVKTFFSKRRNEKGRCSAALSRKSSDWAPFIGVGTLVLTVLEKKDAKTGTSYYRPVDIIPPTKEIIIPDNIQDGFRILDNNDVIEVGPMTIKARPKERWRCRPVEIVTVNDVETISWEPIERISYGIEVENLPAGSYSVRINTGTEIIEYMVTGEMIVIKEPLTNPGEISLADVDDNLLSYELEEIEETETIEEESHV